MSNDDEEITTINKNQSSVRVSKSNSETVSQTDDKIAGFITRLLGRSSVRTLFYMSLIFLILAYASWELTGFGQRKTMTVPLKSDPFQFWMWFSSACFFFYTMFLGLGLVTFFTYLTRRF